MIIENIFVTVKKSLLSLMLFPQGIFCSSFPFYLISSEGDMFILLKKVSYKEIKVCLTKVYVFLLPLSWDVRPPTLVIEVVGIFPWSLGRFFIQVCVPSLISSLTQKSSCQNCPLFFSLTDPPYRSFHSYIVLFLKVACTFWEVDVPWFI